MPAFILTYLCRSGVSSRLVYEPRHIDNASRSPTIRARCRREAVSARPHPWIPALEPPTSVPNKYQYLPARPKPLVRGRNQVGLAQHSRITTVLSPRFPADTPCGTWGFACVDICLVAFSRSYCPLVFTQGNS